MNAAVIPIVIFFVGIAAVVDDPGRGKTVIFPVADNGAYGGLILEQHDTWLHVRGRDLAGVENPREYCAQIKGKWNEDICSLELEGATLAVNSNQRFRPDPSFASIPRFQNRCKSDSAKPILVKPKRIYMSKDLDPDFVAARYDITSGKLSGCNRCEGAFVTKLEVESKDGRLVVRRGSDTLEIPLKRTAQVAVENRPKNETRPEHKMGMHPPQVQPDEHDGKKHYGWYYFIAAGKLTCKINPPAKAAIDACGDIPGVESGLCITPPSASGPDCGNTTYP
jgi:hypothetical protein